MMPGIVGVYYVQIMETDNGLPAFPQLSTSTYRKLTPTGFRALWPASKRRTFVRGRPSRCRHVRTSGCRRDHASLPGNHRAGWDREDRRGGERRSLIDSCDDYGIGGGGLKACFEIQFVVRGGAKRLLLVSDDGIVVSVDGGGELNRVDFENAAHGAGVRRTVGCRTLSGGEATVKLLVQVADLSLELGIVLRQTLSNDVIDEAFAVFQLVTGQVTAKTKGRGILTLVGNGSDHEVNILIIDGGVCRGRKIRRCDGRQNGGGLGVRRSVRNRWCVGLDGRMNHR